MIKSAIKTRLAVKVGTLYKRRNAERAKSSNLFSTGC